MIVLQENFIMERLSLLLLLAVRMSGLFLAAPVLSGSAVTVPVRTALTIGLVVGLFGSVPVPSIDVLSLGGVSTLVREALIGLSIGLIFQLAFAAIAMAGDLIATSMGLGFASMVDPQTGHQSQVVTQFLTILMILIFLVLGGHHVMIRQVAASYAALPIGADLNPKLLIGVVQSGALIFAGALLISLPVIVLLFLVNMLIGLMTRVAPQMNIFSIGFPLTILVGFVALLLAVPTISNQMGGLVESANDAVRERILALGSPT